MSKKTNAPIYAFNVKNSIFGRVFIKVIKKKLNSQRYHVVLRGRHSDRKKLYAKLKMQYRPGTQNDVPLNHAETIGVYIKEKPQFRATHVTNGF